jgi:sarcosine oxidase subunit beta
MKETEVLVIGGGIAGVSTAYHLAISGRRVAVLERGEIASGASGVNAGHIDSVGFGSRPDLQAHLTAGSAEIFARVQMDLGEDIEFRQSGGIQVIQDAEQLEFAEGRVKALGAQGHVIELLNPREARALEPELAPSVLGAIHAPLRAQADPIKATRAFATLAARAGASMLTAHDVTAIAARPAGGYAVRTTGGDIVAGNVVIAAGAWCEPVGRMLGLDIPIIAVRGQMWATAPMPPSVFHTISSMQSPLAWHREPGSDPPYLTIRGGVRVTRHLYGRQRRNGEIVFGGDREVVGYDTSTDPRGIEINHGHAAEVLPSLSRLPIARTWAGLMPFPRDGRALIGRIPGREGLWIVSGLASSGFGRGPMAGKLLADFIHAGAMPPTLAEADPSGRVTEVGAAGRRGAGE